MWHFPAPVFIGRLLDSGYRRRIQPPSQLIERSGIKKGMKVLDLGCGPGAFTPFIARTVGEKGKVYALDIQTDMLKQLERKLAKPENRDIKNIKLIEGMGHERTRLPPLGAIPTSGSGVVCDLQMIPRPTSNASHAFPSDEHVM